MKRKRAITVKNIGLVAAAIAVMAGGAIIATPPSVAEAAMVDVTCNNTTADDTTVQNAINSSTVKDVVRIHGPCLFDATVKLLDNRTYQGDGRGATVIKMANSANLKALFATSTWADNYSSTNSYITFKSMTLDGNKSNNTTTPAGAAVLQFRAWGSIIADIEIQNAPRDAIRASNASSNGTALAGTSVNTTVKDFFIHDVGEVGFHVVDSGNSLTDWNLQDGWIASTGNGFDAVNLENAAGWQVRNLHVYGVSATAISLDRCFGTRVIDNYIEDFGGERAANGYYGGIYCNAQGDSASVIANNTVNMYNTPPTQGHYYYISVDGRYGIPLAAVTGNTVRGGNTAYETGLNFNKSGASSMNITSTGNAITMVGTARTVGAGVTLTAGQ